jgi:hypothetical protein
MASCCKQVGRSPMRMRLTHRLFNTSVVPDDDLGSVIQNIVTPVMQDGLDPLMQVAL